MPAAQNFVLVLLSIATTVICWGSYGPVLHNGQAAMGGGRLRPLICVGISYFAIAIIVPTLLIYVTKMETDTKFSWSVTGTLWSLAGGVAGAVGALGIVMAFTYGGKPDFVMPLVFGCAPIVTVATNVFLARLQNKEIDSISPFFAAGLILVAAGAATVLIFAPKAKGGHGKTTTPVVAPAAPVETKKSDDATKTADPVTKTDEEKK